MNRKNLLALFIVVFTVIASSYTFYIYQVFHTPNLQVEKSDIYFPIYKGTSFKMIQNQLSTSGIINDLVSFSLLAKLKNYHESIKPGMYLIKKNMTNNEAINMFRAGRQVSINVTFNNLRKIEELPAKIEAFFEFDSASLAHELLCTQCAAKYGFSKDNFIAMFVPNTYEFYWTTTPVAFIKRMKKEYKKFWTEDRKKTSVTLGLTPVEIITLASIVEKETKYDTEAARIAGTYINRLKKGMKLQADPTLIFAHDNYNIRRVLNKDKAIDSPYNTYKYKGLPPGPICMPSITTIDAVLNYERHTYLYFCASSDFSGYHTFSDTYKDHLSNAKKWQKALNRKKVLR